MDFWKLIRARYSVRKFKQQSIEPELLHKILAAGRLAPTTSNLQPQRILVLQNENSLKIAKGLTHYHFDAPVMLLICYDRIACWKSPNTHHISGEVDAAIVTTHMMLAATALGLGTTWVGSFDPDEVQKELKLPDHIIPLAFLPIGYPSDHSQPHPNHERRLEEECSIFYNEFPANY